MEVMSAGENWHGRAGNAKWEHFSISCARSFCRLFARAQMMLDVRSRSAGTARAQWNSRRIVNVTHAAQVCHTEQKETFISNGNNGGSEWKNWLATSESISTSYFSYAHALAKLSPSLQTTLDVDCEKGVKGERDIMSTLDRSKGRHEGNHTHRHPWGWNVYAPLFHCVIVSLSHRSTSRSSARVNSISRRMREVNFLCRIIRLSP